MNVFRLTKKKYMDDLTGMGAELAGGRWNYKGTRLLYTSESQALCTAEIAVRTPMGIVPDDYYLITINIPDRIALEVIDLKSLPSNWNKFPNFQVTQDLGDKFVMENKYLILQVPSAVVKGDHNYLINPKHEDFKKITIVEKTKFEFDERLFK